MINYNEKAQCYGDLHGETKACHGGTVVDINKQIHILIR